MHCVTFRQRSTPKSAPPAAQIPALRPEFHQAPQARHPIVQARIGFKQLRVVKGQQVVEGDVLGHMEKCHCRMKALREQVCRRGSMATPSLLAHFSTGTRASVTISFTSKPHSWQRGVRFHERGSLFLLPSFVLVANSGSDDRDPVIQYCVGYGIHAADDSLPFLRGPTGPHGIAGSEAPSACKTEAQARSHCML